MDLKSKQILSEIIDLSICTGAAISVVIFSKVDNLFKLSLNEIIAIVYIIYTVAIILINKETRTIGQNFMRIRYQKKTKNEKIRTKLVLRNLIMAFLIYSFNYGGGISYLMIFLFISTLIPWENKIDNHIFISSSNYTFKLSTESIQEFPLKES